MADDRSEAYREMFTRNKIRECLAGMNTYDQASFVYECIERALGANFDTRHFITVNNIVTETYEDRKQYEV